MESIISTFHIDWKIIIAQMINFAVVFVVLYIFALKPLSKLMAERSDKIKKGIDDAKMNAALLEETKKLSDEILVKARGDSNKIFQEGRKELEKLRTDNLDRIKEDEAEFIKKRKEQIEIDKKTILESVKEDIVNLATLMAEKLVKDKQDLNNL